MRKIDWFDQNPKGPGWLHRCALKPNELVLVEGHTYRYNMEKARDGTLEHVLTPAEPYLGKKA
jgi:hypothetical protein